MNAFRLFSLSLVLLFFGCYDAKVPLGSVEDAPMDPSLEGRWAPTPGLVDDELVSIRIIPFNEHEYYLEYWSQSNPESFPEILRLRGFATHIENARFANMQIMQDDETDYLIAQYQITDDGLLGIRFIDRDMSKIETTPELYRFVRELLTSGELDKEEWAYFKRQDP